MYRYTDYNTPFAVNRSLSLCSRGHTLSVPRFFLPKKSELIHFFQPCEASTVFACFNFSCEVNFFFRQSLKRLSADRLRCEHNASTWLLPSDLFRTYSQTLDCVANFSQNKFSRATFCATCENRVTKLRKPIFACHNLAYKPPRNTRTRATQGDFQTLRLQANSGQTESG